MVFFLKIRINFFKVLIFHGITSCPGRKRRCSLARRVWRLHQTFNTCPRQRNSVFLLSLGWKSDSSTVNMNICFSGCVGGMMNNPKLGINSVSIHMTTQKREKALTPSFYDSLLDSPDKRRKKRRRRKYHISCSFLFIYLNIFGAEKSDG